MLSRNIDFSKPICTVSNINSKHKVLLVDDDNATLEVTATFLLNQGFEVTTTSNGFEALSLLIKTKFNAVIVDACMPIMDGFEVCKRIRKNLDHSQLPVILATGLKNSNSIEQAFNSGATDYLAKPINLQLLSKRLTHMLNEIEKLNRKSGNPFDTIKTLKKTNELVVLLDLQGNLKLSNLNISYNLSRTLREQPTIDHFLERSNHRGEDLFNKLKKEPDHSSSCSFIASESQDNQSYRLKMQLFKIDKHTFCLTINDQTDQLTSELKLYNILNYDTETNLPNANHLENYLSKLDMGGQKNIRRFGIATIALNNLSQIEKQRSQDTVKSLLSCIKLRIKRLLKKKGLNYSLARSSFEKLVITFEQCELSQFKGILKSIFKILSAPFEIHKSEIMLSIDLGASHNFESDCEAKELHKQSEIALVNSNPKKNSPGFYNKALEQKIFDDNRLEELLKEDLSGELLDVHFQPKYDTHNLFLNGMEALLRWNNYELGNISPSQFIPIAEKCHLMNKLSRLVIKKTLHQLSDWKAMEYQLVPISINLDGDNLSDPSLIKYLTDLVNELDIDTKYVEVEVTENIMVEASSDAMNNMKLLKEAGIRIAMDDFGTGYSSFSYLRNLPLDILKIDMSFVKDIESDYRAKAIVQAIISIGHELDLHVIAEGVENKDQLNNLSKMGCDSIQGYLTGKAVTAKQFIQHF
jgi:EAL domain-containing protein (putative c-di-GMP-specific phosphodiesterase class I)/DNA-binding response OmpR family regulator